MLPKSIDTKLSLFPCIYIEAAYNDRYSVGLDDGSMDQSNKFSSMAIGAIADGGQTLCD